MEAERFRAGPRERAADSEDTLHFAELTGVRPMIETYPLEKAGEALRAHDERQGTVPRRSDDVRLAGNIIEKRSKHRRNQLA